MRIIRESGGARLRMQVVEAETLSELLADLVRSLRPDGLSADDPVRIRLFPAGYRDDTEAATAFRDLTEESLRAERVERAEQCLAELASAGGRRRQVELHLDTAATQRWTQVLNDLRLAIGTRLDVSEDLDYDSAVDSTEPEAMQYAVYAFLSGMQDLLVHALMD